MGAYSLSTMVNIICDIIAELYGKNIHGGQSKEIGVRSRLLSHVNLPPFRHTT